MKKEIKITLSSMLLFWHLSFRIIKQLFAVTMVRGQNKMPRESRDGGRVSSPIPAALGPAPLSLLSIASPLGLLLRRWLGKAGHRHTSVIPEEETLGPRSSQKCLISQAWDTFIRGNIAESLRNRGTTGQHPHKRVPDALEN